MMRTRLSWIFALASVSLTGCQHAVDTPLAGEGTSSYKFLEATPPPAKKGEVVIGEALPMTQALNARPIPPLAMPIYPPVALAAHARLATVGVCITVDTTGRVSNVRSSLGILSMPSPFAEEFRAAVEAAVTQWRFRPGELRHLEWVRDPGGDFQRVAARETIEWDFDVEFTFNAMGDVLTRLPKE